MKPLLAGMLALALAGGEAAARAPLPPGESEGIPVLLLVDLGSGQALLARQPDLSFVPASMTKVMTAYVAFEEMRRGRLAPDRRFEVGEQTARVWSGRGTSLRLVAGQSVSTSELLHGIATVSANDASVVLAEGQAGSIAGWAALMNAEARRLGMTRSRFASPSGWPDNGATYVSARDLVRLAEAMIARHPEAYGRYFGQKRMVWQGRVLESHDPTVGVIPGADGIKTGYTREAGYNFLGSAMRDGRRLVLVVAGAKSEEQRALASRALLEWGFAAWEARPLLPAAAIVGKARVQGGDARSLPLVAGKPVYASVPRGSRAPVALSIRYKGPLAAPIVKGQHVADLVVETEGAKPGVVPLQAAASVGRAGFLDRLWNGLAGLVS